jgi:tetratricopeptide (TPR) repeat protein
MFAIVTTAPNLKPEVTTEIKAGSNVGIMVSPGTGEVPAEADVREAIAVSKMSPEEIKKREKLAAEINAKNEKAKNTNQITDKAMKEGKAAYDAKNYDLAIVKYTEGFNADPEFVGSAPVFLNNKGAALKLRGLESYKKSTTDTANKQSLMDSAKKDFQEAINAFQQSVAILKTSTTTDEKIRKGNEAVRNDALRELTETYRLMIGTRADTTQGKQALAVATDYMAAEANAAERTKTLVLLANTLRESGDSESAIPIYRKILETETDNVEALGGLGLSLVNIASASNPPDKVAMQEALNMLDRFAQTAPDTHPLKANVREVAEYLKNTEKLTPQKVARPASKRKT